MSRTNTKTKDRRATNKRNRANVRAALLSGRTGRLIRPSRWRHRPEAPPVDGE